MTKYVTLVCVVFVLGCGQEATQWEWEARQQEPEMKASGREWEEQRQRVGQPFYVDEETGEDRHAGRDRTCGRDAG